MSFCAVWGTEMASDKPGIALLGFALSQPYEAGAAALGIIERLYAGISASIAQASGEVDRVFSYEQLGRERAIVAATSEAERTAVESGADEGTLRVGEVEELPLAYVPGGAVRLRVKVTGDLNLSVTVPGGRA